MNEYENIGPSLPCRIGLIVASVNITRHQPQNATLRADCQQINLSAYIMFLYASDLSQFTSVICISLYIYYIHLYTMFLHSPNSMINYQCHISLHLPRWPSTITFQSHRIHRVPQGVLEFSSDSSKVVKEKLLDVEGVPAPKVSNHTGSCCFTLVS